MLGRAGGLEKGFANWLICFWQRWFADSCQPVRCAVDEQVLQRHLSGRHLFELVDGQKSNCIRKCLQICVSRSKIYSLMTSISNSLYQMTEELAARELDEAGRAAGGNAKRGEVR